MNLLLRKLLATFEPRASATNRATQLLRANLTRGQLVQLDSFGYFEIKGGDSGHRFRINRGEAMNVEEYDETGMCICKWCFLPRGNLVQADILLAQKIALELFELEALQIAKKYPVQSGGSRFQSRTRILARIPLRAAGVGEWSSNPASCELQT